MLRAGPLPLLDGSKPKRWIGAATDSGDSIGRPLGLMSGALDDSWLRVKTLLAISRNDGVCSAQMAMGHNLWLHFGVDEPPFAYFDLKGYRRALELDHHALSLAQEISFSVRQSHSFQRKGAVTSRAVLSRDFATS